MMIYLLRCMSPLMAQSRPQSMSALMSAYGGKDGVIGRQLVDS